MMPQQVTISESVRQRVQDRRDAIAKIFQDCKKTTAQIQELETACERWQAEHAAAQETVAYTDTGKVRAMEDKHAQLRLARTRLARLNESLAPEGELLKPALHELNFLIIKACEPFLTAFRQAAIQALLPFSSDEYAARKLAEQTDRINCCTHFTRQTYDSYPPLHRAAAARQRRCPRAAAGRQWSGCARW